MLSAEQESRALCHPGTDATDDYRRYLTSIFFGEKVADVSAAKSMCFRCPIMAECLRENMNEPWGVYGGLSGDERKHLVKLIKRSAA